MSEVVSVLSDILVALSAAVVAVVAYKGVHAWREQMTGRGNYEVARRVMLARTPIHCFASGRVYFPPLYL